MHRAEPPIMAAARQPALAVYAKFDGAPLGEVALTPAEAADAIVARAEAGRHAARALPRHERARLLGAVADEVEQQAEEFARTIALEAGKVMRQARKEVARCVNTLRLSAEEAKRLAGEVIPFSAYPGSENRSGHYTLEPLGVILAITPFNDPLNLVAHKLGPALAAGNAVILKPSKLAPLSAQRLVEAFWRAGLPRQALQIVHGERALLERLVADRRIRMISFTGGPETGEAIMRQAGLKKMAMDLGGNAPVIVTADADLDDAVASCVSGAFWAAGQNCIGTQRILVAAAIYPPFVERFALATGRLRVGNPLDEEADMGPMISEAEARRIEGWVEEAIGQGARVLTGHRRDGALYAPTVLLDVPRTARVWRDEVFAPVVSIVPFSDLDQAVALANDSESSLHAGVFSRDLDTALTLADALEAGGVMINDSSDYRFDGMPFGGAKYGSLGREGVRFAVHEMSQPKVFCLRRQPAPRS